MSDFLYIAHRGASGRFPENTLLAFRQALAAGADWLELDVHLSADGELVVIHDATLERTTSGQGAVGCQTLVQLRQLDAGRGEQIPRLVEVLDLAVGRATVNIELKGSGTGGAVAMLLQQRSAGLDRVLASSLYEDELRMFSAKQPQIPLALVADQVDRQLWRLARELNLWSLNLEKACVDQELVAQSKAENRRLLIFTVNELQQAKQLKAWGVDGVFTDFPERFSLV